MREQRLQEEEARATALLRGKVVRRIRRHRPEELLVEFDDGTRLFADRTVSEFEVSITGGNKPQDASDTSPDEGTASVNVNLTLTRDEALVLFAFLTRFADEDQLTIDHSAEATVLRQAQCDLKAQLTEPLADDYAEHLGRARAILGES